MPKKKTKKTAKKKSRAGRRANLSTIFAHPSAPSNAQLGLSHGLLCDGIDSVNSLASSYDRVTLARGRGAPTHEDQDLLRAMVVMAGATLDATAKRIVQDALHDLVRTGSEAMRKAREHVKRRLLTNLDKGGGDRLAEALLDEKPHQRIVGFIIEDLTGDSLQSVSQLERAAGFLGVTAPGSSSLRDAFKVRNQIVHEMDATPGSAGLRRRRQRKKNAMRGYAQVLLRAAAQLLDRVDKALLDSN